MAATLVLEEQVEIPLGIASLPEFRRWAASDAFPEQGRIDYFQGRIDVDMSPEDLHTHGKLKSEIARVLAERVKRDDLGELYIDRARVSCPEADVSTEPDLVLVSNEAIDTGRVRLVPKAGAGPDRYVELEGPPDLIVEIVSDTSVRKDTERLPAAYFRAGVPEFWLLDARGEEPIFRIHRRGESQYEAVSVDVERFQQSPVLGRQYRLRRSRNARGRIVFDLDER